MVFKRFYAAVNSLLFFTEATRGQHRTPADQHLLTSPTGSPTVIHPLSHWDWWDHHSFSWSRSSSNDPNPHPLMEALAPCSPVARSHIWHVLRCRDANWEWLEGGGTECRRWTLFCIICLFLENRAAATDVIASYNSWLTSNLLHVIAYPRGGAGDYQCSHWFKVKVCLDWLLVQ